MASKIYEVKAFRDGREVRNVNPHLASLDLTAARSMSALLTGHLYGAVERDGKSRDEAHLYHLEVRNIDDHGQGTGRVLFRWTVPAPVEEL